MNIIDSNPRFIPLMRVVFLVFFLFLLIGCENSAESENNRVSFSLPEDWSVIEEQQLPNRESIAIVTRLGTMVSIETKGCGRSGDLNTIEGCLRRYISVSLPSDEALATADIDISKVNRVSFDGLSAEIRVPAPYNIEYILEVHEIKGLGGTAFVIFNTTKPLKGDLQEEFDNFIKSIKI